MKASPGTFRAWLMRQRRRDDPVGDLARDAAQDTQWPRCPSKMDLMRQFAIYSGHLNDLGACDDVILTLEDAVFSYQEAVAEYHEENRRLRNYLGIAG